MLNAVEQGRVAGLNMAGVQASRLKNIHVNIFTPLSLSCASAGVVIATDARYREVTQRSGENYRKLILEGDRLVGAVLIGEVNDAGLLASLIERNESYPTLRKDWKVEKAFLSYAKVLTGIA